MQASRQKESFLWQHFLEETNETIIVLPSPHGVYKDGISYCDTCAMGKIYARLQHRTNFEMCTPEQLGSDIKKNLILLSGPIANSITKELYASKAMELGLRLDDGLVYDKDEYIVLTPEYLPGETRSIKDLTVDYGLIVYTNNPFGTHTKVLHLAGIRGCGTIAAALAVTDDTFLHRIEECYAEFPKTVGSCKPQQQTVEILVKVRARCGKVDPATLSLEILTVNSGRNSWSWNSKTYQELQPVPPHRLSITLNGRGEQDSSVEAIMINDQKLNCARSPDRRRLLYVLAKHSKRNYLAQSETNGWLMAGALAKKLWNINDETGASELSPDLRRVVSESIITWARHLSKKGRLKLDKKICLDHHYVSREILVFDHDLKKRITDLVYMINHDAKVSFGTDFQLIESQHGRGYRLNIHPALISFTNFEP